MDMPLLFFEKWVWRRFYMGTSMLFALILFGVTYIIMFAFQKIRPYVALISAAVFILVGSLSLFPDFQYFWPDALREIDWNVIMMIIGTMGTVHLFIESKMPQRLSDLILARIHSVKWFVAIISLFAGIISAFVDNVATVLMVAPVALAVCKKLNISPVSSIICISISSNLQGAATLVGDTTSILLAKAANLDFMSFFVQEGKPGMFWVTECGALVSLLILLWMFRRENQRVDVKGHTRVTDMMPTWLLCLTVACLILASFIPYQDTALPGQIYKPDITNGLICLFFFWVGLVRQIVQDRSSGVVRRALQEIDFYTIFLLIGLFIIIGGVQKAGLINLIGDTLAELSGGGDRLSIFLIYSVIVWMSVLFSAFIDNIPYTATMLPVVAVITERLSEAGNIAISPNLLYFGLLVGATLGGNLTPIGASANITGIGILRKGGYEVRAADFMKYSVPFTLAAVATGYILVWVIWM